MVITQPATDLDARFSSPGAAPIPWQAAVELLETAEVFWISTVRADGRPHVVPLLGIWLDDTFFFFTGDGEQKARNLAGNPHCVVTTGNNTLTEATLDVTLEGEARRVTDEPTLRRVADGVVAKYGEGWRYEVVSEGFRQGSGSVREEDRSFVLVFDVAPKTAFGFGRGEAFSQTRWRFPGGTRS